MLFGWRSTAFHGTKWLTPSADQRAHIPSPSTQIPIVPRSPIYGQNQQEFVPRRTSSPGRCTGAGKTSLVFELFRRLGRPLYYINFHNGANIEELSAAGIHRDCGPIYSSKGSWLNRWRRAFPSTSMTEFTDMPEWSNSDGRWNFMASRWNKSCGEIRFLVIGAMNPALHRPKRAFPALRSRLRNLDGGDSEKGKWPG